MAGVCRCGPKLRLYGEHDHVICVVSSLCEDLVQRSPVRTKDKPYLDVISESINNPFRLVIGWTMIDATSLPPGSIILSYWLGGAFLMGVKRLSEYREITASHGSELLSRYRASFRGYTGDLVDSLLLHLRNAFQLLPRGLLNQVSHRVHLADAAGYGSLRSILGYGNGA